MNIHEGKVSEMKPLPVNIFVSGIPKKVFVWFDSLRPINNLSVKQGQVFLGWTSTELG